MVHLAVEAAQARGLARVVARLIPTPRNEPCREFWKGSRFDEPEMDSFVWDTTNPYPKPAFIAIEANTDGAGTQ